MSTHTDQERAGADASATSVFDLPGELASAVRDADQAWQFIDRFAAACGTPLASGDGFAETDLVEAEERLGFALPTSVRHLYRLIGRRDDLTRRQDMLLRPDQLCVDESGQVLVFRVENQAVTQWGIEIATIQQADPPVVFQPYPVGSSEPPWQPFLRRFSSACLEMVLSEWMLSSAAEYDNRELDEATVIALEQQFSRQPLPDYPMWAEWPGPPTRWFHGMGAVLRDDARSWLWVWATSADAMGAIRTALPGDWIMGSDG